MHLSPRQRGLVALLLLGFVAVGTLLGLILTADQEQITISIVVIPILVLVSLLASALLLFREIKTGQEPSPAATMDRIGAIVVLAVVVVLEIIAIDILTSVFDVDREVAVTVVTVVAILVGIPAVFAVLLSTRA